MTTLYGLLNTGRHALSTHKLAIAVTGNNLANAATPGYSRESLQVNPDVVVRIGPQVLGTGVKAGNAARSFDQFTYQRILGENSQNGYYGLQQPELSGLNSVYNEGSSGGLNDSINQFFADFNEISAYPEEQSPRSVALTDAQSLVNRFHSLARSLVDSRTSLDGKIKESVQRINDATTQIASLNAQISTVEAAGGTAGDLRDQRDELIKSVASEADVTSHEEPNGSITLSIAGQVVVQDSVVNQVVTAQDPNNSNLVTISVAAGPIQHEITSTVSGGVLAGAVALRDSTLPGYQTDLDNLAFSLVNSFNAQHQLGFGLDGVSGRDFFTALGASAGAALSISLDAGVANTPDAIAASATATGLPSDNANAVALYQLSNQALVGGQTFSGSFISQAGQVGADARTVTAEAEHHDQLLSDLDQLRESQSGVSIDEETTDLLKYQTAFQAAAKFVSTLQTVINTLVNM